MTRAKIDFYDGAEEAAENASALCSIGLSPNDIAAMWSLNPAISDKDASTIEHQVEIESIGRVALTGWIAHASRDVAHGRLSSTHLAQMLCVAEPTQATFARVVRTLQSGGGIVVVRSMRELGAP